MGEINVGTSGFASPTSRWSLDSLSAAAPDLLAAYAARFDTVELDSVFYRPPSPGTIRTWCDATPEAFLMCVRIPREITHVDRLGLPSRIERLVGSLGELGPRLGCLLFTTPPTFDCDVPRLRAALDAIPSGVRTAWEFRHPSWFACPEVMDLLVEHGSAPVIVDRAEDVVGSEALPGGVLSEKWDFPFVYVRFRKENYRPGDLLAWGRVLSDVVARRPVYAFFRQSMEACAYVTALQELLTEAERPVEGAPLAQPERSLR